MTREFTFKAICGHMCQHHGTRSSTLTVQCPVCSSLRCCRPSRFNPPSVVEAAATQQPHRHKSGSIRSAELNSLQFEIFAACIYSCRAQWSTVATNLVAAVSFAKLAGSSNGECIMAWRSIFSYIPPHCSTRLLQVVHKFTKRSASSSAQLES